MCYWKGIRNLKLFTMTCKIMLLLFQIISVKYISSTVLADQPSVYISTSTVACCCVGLIPGCESYHIYTGLVLSTRLSEVSMKHLLLIWIVQSSNLQKLYTYNRYTCICQFLFVTLLGQNVM